MAEKLGKVVLEAEYDDTKVNAGIDKTQTKATGLAGTFGKVSGAGKILTGVVGGTVVGALSDFANSAAADEANSLKLQTAIENSGVSWDDYADKIDDVIAKGQDLAFSDDDTRNSLASLTESTGSVEEAMKRLPVAMDLARAKGISLEAASKLLGKVSDENTKVLKKYGIVMEEGATATDVLAKVQQIAGGQAEVYGSTTSGWIAKVKDGIGEFTEGIGASLGPAQGFIALLPGMSAGMSLAGGAVGALSSALGIQRTGMMLTIPVAGGLNLALGPLILVIGAIAIAAALLALAWSNNWGDIQGVTARAVAFWQDAFDGVRLFLLNTWMGIVTGIAGAVNGIIGVINGFIQKYNFLAEKLGLPLIGEISLITPNLAAVDAAINQIARDRQARISVSMAPTNAGGEVRGMFAEGTHYVPFTGPALVHRGEAIIPADKNPWAGGGGSGEGHGHPIVMDGRVVAQAVGRRFSGGAISGGQPFR
jgi:hypothetical protein